MINDGDSQTSLLPIFSEGGGTSVHWLSIKITVLICLVKKMYNEAIQGVYYLRIRRKTLSKNFWNFGLNGKCP